MIVASVILLRDVSECSDSKRRTVKSCRDDIVAELASRAQSRDLHQGKSLIDIALRLIAIDPSSRPSVYQARRLFYKLIARGLFFLLFFFAIVFWCVIVLVICSASRGIALPNRISRRV
jgi:hypothetical protein